MNKSNSKFWRTKTFALVKDIPWIMLTSRITHGFSASYSDTTLRKFSMKWWRSLAFRAARIFRKNKSGWFTFAEERKIDFSYFIWMCFFSNIYPDIERKKELIILGSCPKLSRIKTVGLTSVNPPLSDKTFILSLYFFLIFLLKNSNSIAIVSYVFWSWKTDNFRNVFPLLFPYHFANYKYKHSVDERNALEDKYRDSFRLYTC